jgi:hypothetical protein
MIETQLKNLIVPTSSSVPEISTRLYIGSMPDTVTYPCAVMYSISRFHEVPEADVRSERIQLSCYAANLSSATDIADAIKDKVVRYYGQSSTTDPYVILDCRFDNMNYIYESEIQKYVRVLDVIVKYRKV